VFFGFVVSLCCVYCMGFLVVSWFCSRVIFGVGGVVFVVVLFGFWGCISEGDRDVALFRFVV